jgi:putative heme transporter
LTTFWNVVSKLTLPIVAVLLLATRGELPGTRLVTAASAGGGALLAVLVLGAAALLCDPLARAVGGVVQRLVDLALRVRRSSKHLSCTSGLLELSADLRRLLRCGWHRMALGMTAYAVLQATLLWAVLGMFDSHLDPIEVFAGFAIGRLLSLVVLTPGGVGLADLGTAALLVTLGGDPAAVVAATVVYTVITFALEIPVGGVCGVIWWRGPGRARVAA